VGGLESELGGFFGFYRVREKRANGGSQKVFSKKALFGQKSRKMAGKESAEIW